MEVMKTVGEELDGPTQPGKGEGLGFQVSPYQRKSD